jgi:hypothetical protein
MIRERINCFCTLCRSLVPQKLWQSSSSSSLRGYIHTYNGCWKSLPLYITQNNRTFSRLL